MRSMITNRAGIKKNYIYLLVTLKHEYFSTLWRRLLPSLPSFFWCSLLYKQCALYEGNYSKFPTYEKQK